MDNKPQVAAPGLTTMDEHTAFILEKVKLPAGNPRPAVSPETEVGPGEFALSRDIEVDHAKRGPSTILASFIKDSPDQTRGIQQTQQIGQPNNQIKRTASKQRSIGFGMDMDGPKIH